MIFICQAWNLQAKADLIIKPVTFFPGQQLSAASLNSNFDTIYTAFNGGISNANISPTAAIQLSKININAFAFSKQVSGSNAWGSGITGDVFPRITMKSDGYLLFGSGALTMDVGLQRPAVNTIRLFLPGGGTPTLDMNGGSLINLGSITLVSPLSIPNGGTGQITAPLARAALGAAGSGANTDITALNGLTTSLSIAQGGTSGNSAATARTALNIAQLGANSDITSLTGLTTPLAITRGGTGLGAVVGANNVLGMNAGNTAFEGKNIAAGTNITVTHGVGTITIAAPTAASIELLGNYAILNNTTTVVPTLAAIKKAFFNLVCTTAQLGYAIGDRAQPIPNLNSGPTPGITWAGTNITLVFPNASQTFVINKTTRAVAQITNGNWQLEVFAIH